MDLRYGEITRQTHALFDAYTALIGSPHDKNGIFASIAEDLLLKYHVRALLELVYPMPTPTTWLNGKDFQMLATWVQSPFQRKNVDKQSLQKHLDIEHAHFQAEFGERAVQHLRDLHHFILTAEDGETLSRRVNRVMNRLHMEALPQLELGKVKNLVLAGGGAKTMSLTGFLAALEDNPQVAIRRVAGTSGGAILAMAYAVGMSSDEIKSIVIDNNFGVFTVGSRADNVLVNLFTQHVAKNDPSHTLHAASDLPFYHAYHKHLMNELTRYLQSDIAISAEVKQKMRALNKALSTRQIPHVATLGVLLKALPKKQIQEIERVAKGNALRQTRTPTESVLWTTNAYPSPRQALLFAMRRHLGLDLIREFLADILESRLSQVLRNKPFVIQTVFANNDAGTAKLPETEDLQQRFRDITFKELFSLHQVSMTDFRELHVSMCVRRHALERAVDDFWRKYRFVDASHEHHEFMDLPIVEAVRVSMNLPGVYPEYRFTLGDIEYGGVDGGLLSNLSMDTFDVKTSLQPAVSVGEFPTFREVSERRYHKMETVGVFYKTGMELQDVAHFSTILASNKSIQRLDAELKLLTREIDMLQQSLVLPGITPAAAQRIQLDIAKKQGKYAAVELEQNNKLALDEQPWSLGKAVQSHLQKKNEEYGHRSIDVRRLAIINTQQVDTAHFKLGRDVKMEQHQQGYAAGLSLLSQAHCLENEFYRNQLSALGVTLKEPESVLTMAVQMKQSFR